MNEITKSQLLEDLAKSLMSLYTESRELAAIWLNKALITAKGRTIRLAPDAEIAVVNGAVVDVTDTQPATHRVIGCYGTLVDQFEISVVNIETLDPSIIKL